MFFFYSWLHCIESCGSLPHLPDTHSGRSCGGIFNATLQGSILSPNWPGEYPAYSHCTWEITTARDRRILIVIPEISLGDSGQRGVEYCGDELSITASGKHIIWSLSYLALYLRIDYRRQTPSTTIKKVRWKWDTMPMYSLMRMHERMPLVAKKWNSDKSDHRGYTNTNVYRICMCWVVASNIYRARYLQFLCSWCFCFRFCIFHSFLWVMYINDETNSICCHFTLIDNNIQVRWCRIR